MLRNNLTDSFARVYVYLQLYRYFVTCMYKYLIYNDVLCNERVTKG
jgi:hypothetical protein